MRTILRLLALAALCAGLTAALTTGTAAAASCAPGTGAYATGGAPGTGAANDPLFSRQWGLTQIKAPAAWKRGVKGTGVTIAVIDTGTDKRYVRRNKDGSFKESDDVGRSLSMDRKRKAKTKAGKGQGDRGD